MYVFTFLRYKLKLSSKLDFKPNNFNNSILHLTNLNVISGTK